MAYRLFGDTGSGSAIVELALAEIGIGVDLEDVPLHTKAQESRAYTTLNPQRKLPCLVTPEGETLTESASILLTLDERHPESGLLPVNMRDRAFLRRWLIFLAAELYPIIEFVDYPERFQPEGEATTESRRAELTKHARAIWNQRFLLVEHAIVGEQWFLTSGFSALDIYVTVLSRWAQNETWRLANLPRIERIATELSKRRRLEVVWRRHFG